MTRDEYRAHPSLNFSLAKMLLKSPAHFRAAVDEEHEETDAMRVGTMAHSMILDGVSLLDLYAVKPAGMSFATKDGKAWRDAQTLPIITEEDASSIPRIAESIAGNPDAVEILTGCKMRERPVFATMHGVECKALIDACGVGPGGWGIGDFKTAADASPRKFESVVFDMDYDMQASWYADILSMVEGIESEPWWFWIVAEKKPPFVNVVYQASAEVMASGRAKVAKALALYRECLESGEWPLPFRGVTTLNLPAWANRNEQ